MRHEWVVRFDYGKIRPWVRRRGTRARRRRSSPRSPARTCWCCAGTRLPQRRRRPPRATSSRSSEGEELTFSTTWFPSHQPIPRPLDVDAPDRRDRSRLRERWAGPVRLHRALPRRGAPLPADAAAAHPRRAPAASSPRPPPRCPRTSAASATGTTASAGCATPRSPLEALLASGYVEETRLWRDWLLRAVAGDPEDLQIMYAVDGARDLPERDLRAPARLRRLAAGADRQRRGRPAADRRARRGDDRPRAGPAGSASRETRRLLGAAARRSSRSSATHWDEPDNGLWEIRGPPRHFTHSRVMVWAAFDRAGRRGRAARPATGPSSDGARCATTVRAGGARQAASTASATPSPSTTTPTRSTPRCCCIPIVGFLDGDDPRVLGTIAAVEEDLLRDGSGAALPHRHAASTGWPATSTRSSPARSGWSRLRRAGRVDEAHALMDRLVGAAQRRRPAGRGVRPGRRSAWSATSRRPSRT